MAIGPKWPNTTSQKPILGRTGGVFCMRQKYFCGDDVSLPICLRILTQCFILQSLAIADIFGPS
jgi:hypothetical protein